MGQQAELNRASDVKASVPCLCAKVDEPARPPDHAELEGLCVRQRVERRGAPDAQVLPPPVPPRLVLYGGCCLAHGAQQCALRTRAFSCQVPAEPQVLGKASWGLLQCWRPQHAAVPFNVKAVLCRGGALLLCAGLPLKPGF